jgi:hypothetical protein
VLASRAGLTSLVSEIGASLPPVHAIKENQFEAGVTQPIGRMLNVGVELLSFQRQSSSHDALA